MQWPAGSARRLLWSARSPATDGRTPALTRPGMAVGNATRRKRRHTYPELDRCRRRLVVFGLEVGGRWAAEAASFLRLLARARAAGTPAALSCVGAPLERHHCRCRAASAGCHLPRCPLTRSLVLPVRAPCQRPLAACAAAASRRCRAPRRPTARDFRKKVRCKKIIAQPPGLWLPFKAKVIYAGNAEIACKADLPRVPPAHKGTWVRIADPSRTEVHLTTDSNSALRWLQQCFAHERLRPLKQAPLLTCYAAADAMADEKQVGIGGWIVTALGATTWKFALPSPASDNTAAEARAEKLWSTAEPLGTFLKLAAGWAARHHIEFLATHHAGVYNVWADELSRNNLSRFRNRMHQIMTPLRQVTGIKKRWHRLHSRLAVYVDQLII